MIDQIQPESVEYFGSSVRYEIMHMKLDWSLPSKKSFQLKDTFHQQIRLKLKEEI